MCFKLWCVYRVPDSVLSGTRYTHHSLKHMLPQYCTTYNNIFLLITSTKV